MKLSDLIVTDAIVPHLAATNRDDAIAELIAALVDAGALPADGAGDISAAVLKREAQVSTGIGKGVAFPHARIKGVRRAVAVIGRRPEGIDFKSLDGQPVEMVLLLLSNSEDPDEHLEAMETIFQHVHRQAFRDQLKACETREEIAAMVQTADSAAA